MKRPRSLQFHGLAMLGIVAATTGCADAATGPVHAVAVEAIGVAPRTVAVSNRSDQPIFATAFGRQAVALIDWAACVDGPECQPIAGGATRLHAVSSIEGTPETEAVVYWWRAVRGADGRMQPDSIRSVVVRL